MASILELQNLAVADAVDSRSCFSFESPSKTNFRF